MGKKGQNLGGNKNVPGIQLDSEQDRFCAEISTEVTNILERIERMKALPAGAERDAVVVEAEDALRRADKVAKNVVGGSIPGGLALGKLRAAKKQFEGIKKLLDSAGAAGIRAAEKAAEAQRVRAEQEARELVEIQRQEDAERLLSEARERLGRGEATDDDRRLIVEHDARRIEQERAPIQAIFDDTRPTLKAVRTAIKRNDGDGARSGMELLEQKLASLNADYGINSDAVIAQGFDPGTVDSLVFYRGRIDDFEREVAALRAQISAKEEAEHAADAASQAERETAERESARREEIGQRFSARITELDGQMQNVFAMPIGTAAEAEAARRALDDFGDAMEKHSGAWDAEVKPIFQGMSRRPEGAWGDLVFRQSALREGFSRNVRARRDAIREKFGEAAKERWEAELPKFELSLAYAEMQELDARMLRGAKRKEELEALQERIVRPILEQWRGAGGERGLREFAPSLTREQIESGVRTERAAFDGRVKALEQRVKEGIEADENVKPARLFEVVRTWRNLLARTSQLWNPGTEIGDRGVFLEEKYGPGEAREGSPEFAAMVSEGHRAEFEMLAHTEVFRALRRRGREDQRERAAREREERRSLPQVPKLNFVRLLADDAYWDLRNARFWNPKIKNNDFRRVLRTGKTMTDEELAPFVSDIPAFRSAVQELESARADVLRVEDVMLGKHGEETKLEGKMDAAAVLEGVRGYAEWKRRESQAWNRAMNARGWKMPRPERKKKLHEFFRGYWAIGAEALRGVPGDLRGPIGDWANAQLHVRVFGRYTQWVLDENTDIAVELRKRRKIPMEFAVAIPEVPAELSPADRTAVDAFVPERVDENPAPSDDDHDEVAVGSFVADAGDAVERFTGDVDDDEASSRAADIERAPETLPVYSAAGGAPQTSEAAPVGDRARLLRENDSWNVIKRLLADDIFWNADADRGTRGTMLAAYRRKGTMNTNRLREDRVGDFEYATAFTDVADLERRVAEIRAKYAEAAPATVPVAEAPSAPVTSVASVPVETPVVAAAPVLSRGGGGASEAAVASPAPRSERSEGSVSVASRTDTAPRPPRSVDDAAPSAPVRFEPVSGPRAESAPVRSIPVPAGESEDPFARFFGGGGAAAGAPAVEARLAARTEAPRPSPVESAPVPPARPVVRPSPAIEPVAPTSSRVEISIESPGEAPREVHAEDRVALWSRSLRNTFGRIFGSAPAAVEAPAAAARTESVPPAEVSRRTAGGVMGVLSRFFGPKIFADVPRYLPESFGDQNARALLQADILDAMEDNAAAMKNVVADPERIHAANLDAAARLDRAIATSRLSPEAKKDMRDRVVALQEKYTERTRENAIARSRELAGIVEQSVRVLEAPGRRGSPALRLLSRLPFGIGTNLAHGVGDFRKRFETAVSRGGDTGLVARVATVFRETWEEAMQGIRTNGSLSGRAMNAAEAVAMIGSAYGVSATVTALEQVLPSLRSLTGSERDVLSRLAAEGRLQVQETADNVLPRAEQAMRRAA